MASLFANFASHSVNDNKGNGNNFHNRRGNAKGKGRGRNGGRYNNQRLMCLVCNRAGHMALQCYMCFDQSIQYQSSQNVHGFGSVNKGK